MVLGISMSNASTLDYFKLGIAGPSVFTHLPSLCFYNSNVSWFEALGQTVVFDFTMQFEKAHSTPQITAGSINILEKVKFFTTNLTRNRENNLEEKYLVYSATSEMRLKMAVY